MDAHSGQADGGARPRWPQTATCLLWAPRHPAERQAAIDAATATLAQLGVRGDIVTLADSTTNRDIRLALGQSTAECCILFDARDGARLDDLDCLLPLAARHDVVCGRRRHSPQSWPTRAVRWAHASLAQLLAGTGVADPHSPLIVLRRDAAMALARDDRDAADVRTALLAEAAAAGLRIAEADIRDTAPVEPLELIPALRDAAGDTRSLLRYWWNDIQFPTTAIAGGEGRNWFWIGLLLVAFISGALLFPFLDYPLFEPDEGRYAEISRKMLSSGNFIVPSLHNEPYLDKPPLLYWLIAGSFALLGTEDWTARLVPATAAWLTVIITYLFACRTVGIRPALLASLALSLSLGYAPGGRFLILDSLLTLWVGLSLHMALEAVRGPTFRWPWWLASAVCCGLAMLTKGPIGLVLWLPPLAAYVWLDREAVRVGWKHLAIYVGLAVLIVLPWFVAVVASTPNFMRYFFWEHHIERFLTGMTHAEPFWYYLPVLLIVGAPWTFLTAPLVYFQFSRSPAVAALRPRISGFYLLWAAWCLLFFSLASCKLPTYILPALPAIALLLGVYLHQATALERRSAVMNWVRRVAPQWAVGILCCTAIGVVWAAWILGLRGLPTTIVESLAFGAVMLGVIAFGQRLQKPVAWGLCGVVAFVVTFESARQVVPAWAESRSPMPHDSPMAALLRDRQTAVVVCYREWASVPFYLERNDVLRFDGERPRELANLLRQHPRTVLVHKRGESTEVLELFIPHGMSMSKVGDAGRASFWLVQPKQLAKQPQRPIRSARRLP